VNGANVHSSTSPCVPGSEPLQMRMGYPINGGTGYGFFQGEIDELAIYNRALTAAEIATIYAIETGGQVVCRKP
jgi:hypothetical protein